VRPCCALNCSRVPDLPWSTGLGEEAEDIEFAPNVTANFGGGYRWGEHRSESIWTACGCHALALLQTRMSLRTERGVSVAALAVFFDRGPRETRKIFEDHEHTDHRCSKT
jgi:hypothetical protein